MSLKIQDFLYTSPINAPKVSKIDTSITKPKKTIQDYLYTTDVDKTTPFPKGPFVLNDKIGEAIRKTGGNVPKTEIIYKNEDVTWKHRFDDVIDNFKKGAFKEINNPIKKPLDKAIDNLKKTTDEIGKPFDKIKAWFKGGTVTTLVVIGAILLIFKGAKK
jgi:hypothetical protein